MQIMGKFLCTDPADANHKIVDASFGEFPDWCRFNGYVGWHDGLPEKIDRICWSIKYQKPVSIRF